MVTNEVVQAICRVGIDEAVTDPLTGSYGLVDVGDHLESCFNAVLVDLTGCEGFIVGFSRKSKDVKSVFARKSDELAVF